MSTQLETSNPQQHTQLVSDFVKIIFENICQFGPKCRSFMQSQHQLGITVAPLQIAQQSNILPIPSSLPHSYQPPPIRKPINTNQERQNKPVPKQPKQKRSDDTQQPPFMAKRPRNAYNLFVQSQSVKIKQENPHMRAPDIVRIAAERYNSMNEEQKRPYLLKFEEAKRTYDRQVQQMGGRMPIQHRKRGGKGARNDYTLKSF